jgi:DNA modification methylase
VLRGIYLLWSYQVSIGQHQILIGDTIDVMRGLPAGHFHTAVTSPPYWGLRDYGVDGQIGLEGSPDAFVAKMVDVFREVRRVLREDGTCWVNLGDSYNAHPGQRKTTDAAGPKQSSSVGSVGAPSRNCEYLKPKDLCGIPWRVALALQADGWWLRSDIIWHKPAPMPESVTDRPTRAHEYIFLLTKSERYFYDAEAVKEAGSSPEMTPEQYEQAKIETSEAWYQRKNNPHGTAKSGAKATGFTPPGGRNRRTVWTVASEPFAGAHFATYPTKLIEPCIKAGSSERGCCPECGAPWRRIVDRKAMVIERSERTHDKGRTRTSGKMVSPPQSVCVGWEPTCSHDLSPVPCRVLDPFSGSGTTAGVACRLGRDAVGIELNPKYAAMSEDRIATMTRPTTARTDEVGDSPLFVDATNA